MCAAVSADTSQSPSAAGLYCIWRTHKTHHSFCHPRTNFISLMPMLCQRLIHTATVLVCSWSVAVAVCLRLYSHTRSSLLDKPLCIKQLYSLLFLVDSTGMLRNMHLVCMAKRGIVLSHLNENGPEKNIQTHLPL